MIAGHVLLRTDFPEIEVRDTQVPLSLSNVTSVTIKSTKPTGFTAQVHIQGASSFEDARELAAVAANQIAEIAAFHLGTYIGQPVIASESLVDDTGVHHLGDTLPLFCCATAWPVLTVNECAALSAACIHNSQPGRLYYPMLRAALSLIDPLAQFMALYSIVLQLCNDSQEDVDNYILSIQHATPTNAPFRRRRSGVKETVYTRLRNEVGHVRPGTTISGTRTEMQQHLPGLISVAKTIIAAQP